MSGAYLFIEATGFSSSIESYFGTDEVYGAFQSDLAADPDRGAVIPGAAPLRKIRWGDKRRGLGKRGGLRVIYIHIPDIGALYMLDVYAKGEVDDLTTNEKKSLQALARELVEELRLRKKRGLL